MQVRQVYIREDQQVGRDIHAESFLVSRGPDRRLAGGEMVANESIAVLLANEDEWSGGEPVKATQQEQGAEARLCRRARAATDKPVWIKANAGLPELVAGRAVYRVSPESSQATSRHSSRQAPASSAAAAGRRPNLFVKFALAGFVCAGSLNRRLDLSGRRAGRADGRRL